MVNSSRSPSAEYHPSYGIGSGNCTVQRDIRDQFSLYKAVCAVADVAQFHGQPITEDVITADLECEHIRRLEQKTENLRVLAKFLQQDQANIQKVMTRFPFIGYNDVRWLASTVAYLEEHSMTRVTATQRIMLPAGYGRSSTTYMRSNFYKSELLKNT